MSARKSLSEFLCHRPVPFAGNLAVALAAVEVVVDWCTWIELNVSLVYVLPLVLAAAARDRRLLWGLAGLLIGMTFAVYAVQIPAGTFSLGEPYFINRVLSSVAVVLSAGLLHAWTLAADTLESQGSALRVQNGQLEAANRELLRCQEEIARQNVELDHRRLEAEEASSRKSRLLASASHDIRGPVNAINMIAEVIRRTADDPALAVQVPGLAQRLQANAASLTDLVSDVLDVSSIDSGRVSLHECDFSLNDLLAAECQRMLPLAQAKGLRLTAEPPASPIEMRTDRVKLARVLTNLVTNAVKFTDAGGVTVSAELTPEHAVVIRVRDTGVGIAPADLGRIFDDFTQVHNPGSRSRPGWGLGLAICRRLVVVLGGQITVESQPDCGSVFTVHLPPSCVVGQPGGEPARVGCENCGAAAH
ncbi:MAG TPA: HAMP domain-containing sensor histidine kinase [Fimbriiglobus sp.]|nr:HAMP domain-containing sensor histidine kinase [Fimbriiglobus sp.]